MIRVLQHIHLAIVGVVAVISRLTNTSIANQGQAELIARLRHEREKQRSDQGTLPDSTADIRAEREARW